MHSRFRSILKSSAGSLSSLLLGALAVKVVAVILGPGGVGLFSLLRQLQQTFTSLSTLSGDTALVQGLCARQGLERTQFLFSAVAILLVCTCSATLLAYIWVPTLLSGRTELDVGVSATLGNWLAFAIFFASGSVVMMALLNAKRELGCMALTQATAALIGATSTYFLCTNFGRVAVAPLLGIIALSSFCISTYFVLRSTTVARIRASINCGFDRFQAKRFVAMAGITLVVGFAGAGTLLLVRLLIIGDFGLNQAGFFDASWTLSTVYLVVLLSSFGTYFLPTMSAAMDTRVFFVLLQDLFKLSVVFSTPIIVFAVVTKSTLLSILYSTEFIEAADMMRWMLIGDYVKVSGWVFSIPMLAKRRLWPYLWLAICWDAVFLAAAGVVIWSGVSIEYIGAAYVLAQCVFTISSIAYWRNSEQFRLSAEDTWYWFAGLTIIVFASILKWIDRTVTFYDLFWLLPVVGHFCYGLLRFYSWKLPKLS